MDTYKTRNFQGKAASADGKELYIALQNHLLLLLKAIAKNKLSALKEHTLTSLGIWPPDL